MKYQCVMCNQPFVVAKDADCPACPECQVLAVLPIGESDLQSVGRGTRHSLSWYLTIGIIILAASLLISLFVSSPATASGTEQFGFLATRGLFAVVGVVLVVAGLVNRRHALTLEPG